MITKLLVDGVLKLVQIRKSQNKNVARVYDPKSQIPETILNEIAPNCYENGLTGDLFKVEDGAMVVF